HCTHYRFCCAAFGTDVFHVNVRAAIAVVPISASSGLVLSYRAAVVDPTLFSVTHARDIITRRSSCALGSVRDLFSAQLRAVESDLVCFVVLCCAVLVYTVYVWL